MKGSKSPTIGTKDFCHPLRTVNDFDETIDDFSLASIALSLKAISMKSTLLDIYGASDRLLFSENDYRNPSNSKVISALQELICDKDFCTLYSLFMLALARKELSACSFRLFIGEKPNITSAMDEDLSTKPTEEELKEAFVDEWGVIYSKDGRKLLAAQGVLNGAYSVKEGTRIICDRAFSHCRYLPEIVIPSSVTSIGDSAFSFCDSLSKVVIPSSVTSIGDRAFSWGRFLSEIVIPSSVTSIGDRAFSLCSSLSEIVIPFSVTSIGDSAFYGCDSLSKVVIPSSVTSIGKDAFFRCDSLSEIVIPSSVTSIGDWAFSSCSSLKYISIPKSVICLNGNPFAEWNGKLECLSPNFVYEDDVLFNKDKSRIISFRNQNVKSYVIPPSATSIGDYAFGYCDSLSEIVIPSSVTSIGHHAFYSCCSLSNIVIPSSVTSIGDLAFYDCKFPDNLKQELISRFGDNIF